MKYQNRELDHLYLKEMKAKELVEVAKFLRTEIIEVVAKNGGHLSSNLGVVELTLGLLKVFDPLKDDILFDVGHQTYAYKMLTGRDLSLLRKKEGVAPFSDLEESVFDKYSAGHSSTSLSVALGMAKAKKLKGDDSYTVAVIGDGSITNGLAMEALNQIGTEKDLKLIIVLNDNGMSISKPTGAVAKTFSKIRKSHFYVQRSLSFKKVFNHRGLRWVYSSTKAVKDAFKRLVLRDTIFESMDIIYNGPYNGNSIKHVINAFNYSKEMTSPIILHFMTKKGLGYEFAQDDHIGSWHGTEAFDIANGKPLAASNGIGFSDLAASYIYEILKKDPLAYLISPAMVYGSKLNRCFEDFKDRTIDVGISEEHAITFAAGLALKGFHPIISIYSTFLQRSYDELLHDLARMNLSVMIFIERCGLVGADGSSHQGIFDYSFLKTIPNTKIIHPAVPDDFKEILANSDDYFNSGKIVSIRLTRDRFVKEGNYPLLKNTGYKKALVAIGTLGLELIKAAEGFDSFLVKDVWPLDNALISKLINYESITLYDPYSSEDGMASSLGYRLSLLNYGGEYRVFCLPITFIKSMSIEEQLQAYGLDILSVLKKL